MSQLVGNLLWRWITWLLGGVKPEDRLPPDLLAPMREEWRQITRPVDRVVTPITAAVLVSVALTLAYIRSKRFPSQPPVMLAESGLFTWMGFLVAAVFALMVVREIVAQILLRTRFPGGYEYGRRFCCSATGWTPWRSAIGSTLVFGFLTFAMAGVGWAGEDRVDGSGIVRARSFGSPHLEPFSDVSSVTLFATTRGLLGVNHKPVIRVTFKSSDPWLGEAPPPQSAQHLASYIADQAGVPLVFQPVLP